MNMPMSTDSAMQQELMSTPAYRIEGGDRPSRWLVTCDHATNRVPDWVNGGDLGIAAEDMARHIAYDVGAAGLASSEGWSPQLTARRVFPSTWKIPAR